MRKLIDISDKTLAEIARLAVLDRARNTTDPKNWIEDLIEKEVKKRAGKN